MSHSHYQTTLIAETGSYFFTSDSGHQYTVYFDTKSSIFPNEDLDRHAVYIGFSCVPEIEKFQTEYDPKIGVTIMWLIANFFQNHKNAILTYVCSPRNNYARHRFITFSKWFKESGLSERLELKKKIIGNTYCGALIGKKNSLHDALEIAMLDFNEDKFESGFEQFQEEDDEYLLSTE